MENSGNTLYPAFLKLDKLPTLIIGGGNVGLEKASFILKNSPNANITMVSMDFLPELKELVQPFSNVTLIKKEFEESDLNGKRVVICATNNNELHRSIKKMTESAGILTNVADTPDLCDFYLGSIVSKGDLKIAISTNGKSPTLAKRMREYLEGALPKNTQDLLNNLGEIRDKLTGDFNEKIKELNEITKSLKDK